MEGLIMAIYYGNEKNINKVKKLIRKIVGYVKSTNKKIRTRIDFLNDISTVIITAEKINALEYYSKILSSTCLYNANFSINAIVLLGVKYDVLNFIESNQNLKINKKVLIIRENDYCVM
ncbi:MAG: hypothetical protein LKF87_10140 [Clostridium tyrobutyricum]|jgi:hypothetical protein|uniref:hypothetical protein n=1 Tax=Clostridium tyrobutyricum TaxID=1519 RepID=UPI00242E457D|nr:hypothetical protein [Clostridium tyrobutyricum]MCH4201249.1 hypothetical protein [Clostridium tyrobutyricum]MCH4237522.1 hypothetical protein [Clostridium tyrobutyricum]MCH4259309.1 hypothetical protein [Clostridium tyrobutyricum]